MIPDIDTSLVLRAQSGDEDAFEQLCHRHFARVYDFLARLAQRPEDVEAAVRDTFSSAMIALGSYHGGSAQSWLFTVAYQAALRAREVIPAGNVSPAIGSPAAAFDVLDPARLPDSEPPAEAVTLAPLVWAAGRELDPRQLALLDLHLRQGLDSDEIARVLGLHAENGRLALGRLTAAVDDAMCAYVLAKTQRCPGLAAVLASSTASEASGEARKAIDAHAEACPDCGPRRHALAPLAVFAALAPVVPPEGMEDSLLADLAGQWPGRVIGSAPRIPAVAARRGGRLSGVSGAFVRVGAALGAAAVVLAALLVLPSSPLSLTREDGRKPVLAVADSGGTNGGGITTQPTATATHTPTNTPVAAGVTRPPGPTSTTEAQVVATATQTPAATATNTATATPPGTPTPTATKPACSPSLGTFAGPLNVPSGSIATFVLSNLQFLCGPANYAIAAGAAWLSVTPTSGSIGPGQSATISVAVDDSKVPEAEGAYSGALSVTGPAGQAFDIQVITARGGQAPAVSFIAEQCSRTDSNLMVRVGATDDIGVIVVGVRYTDTTGQSVSQALSLVGGNVTNGTWEAHIALTPPAGVVSYVVQATDGAGRTGSISRACG